MTPSLIQETIRSRASTFGDDWPAWQRNLHPVTYWEDAGKVDRKLAEIEREIAHNRRQLHWYAKNDVPARKRLMEGYRREIDKLERWARNCRTQQRIIANSRPRLTAGRDFDARVRAMPTAALSMMLAAE